MYTLLQEDRGSKNGSAPEQLMVDTPLSGMATIPILQGKASLNPMTYKIVTCFDEKKLKKNGFKLLNEFKENWQPNIEFHCYYYNLDISNYSLPEAKNIHYHKLEDIDEYNTFVEENSTHDGTEDGVVQYTELLDALSAGPEVFAITECGFKNQGCWLLWVDPMCATVKDIRASTLDYYFPDPTYSVDFIYTPETSYLMAFNLSRQTPVDIMGDWRGSYMSGEFTNYREWSSAFILSRLVTIYTAHGMTVHEFVGMENLIININDKSSINVRDSSGKRVIDLSDTETTPDILPGRYRQLADTIRFYKPTVLLETGTWNGGRAIEMALAAFDNSDTVHYIGYDLFEDATTATDKEEFNAKPHNTKKAVENRFDEFSAHMKKEKGKEFTYELHRGNVRETLKSIYIDEVDFALIGSGNSIETVKHEYSILKNVPVVMGDHFFTKDNKDRTPEDKYQGMKNVFDSIATKKINEEKTTEDGWTSFDEKATVRKYVLPSDDRVLDGGRTHLVVFLHDEKLDDIPAELKQVPIVVHPRDSVPKEYIRNNIKTNLKHINKDKWVQKHPAHRGRAVLVSAGPYLDYSKLKKFITSNPDCKVLTVKHALPGLIKNNINPWGCIVLDPRPITGKSTHNITRKDLFKNFDPSMNFFVASMTDPSVTEHLIERDATIWGWHAFTDSLREEEEQGKVIEKQQVKLSEELGIPQGATLITGGTCAAMRGIGMLHTMGFRDIHLFGFDCCRDEPSKKEKTETTGDLEGGETPKPKYIQVNVKDQTYWTTGELLAMAQDCEKVFNDPGLEGVLCFHGKNTMVADLWDIKESQETRPQFKGYYND